MSSKLQKAASSLVPAGSKFSIKSASLKKFSLDQLLHNYRLMLTSRRLDEKMLNLLKQGRGFFHIGGSGHECIQLALAEHMQKGKDWSMCYYRDMAYSLGMGMTPRQLLSAHLSKVTDTSYGKQMPSHFNSKNLRIVSVSSALGNQFLTALGLAQGSQQLDAKEVVYVSTGDGGTSEGVFFEMVNWATRVKAPLVMVVQDNKFAISVPVDEQTSNSSISKSIQGFDNLTIMEIDGTDWLQSWAAAEKAVEHARNGNGPVLIHAHVVRLLPHSSSDDHRKYRSEEELERDMLHDPILKMEEYISMVDLTGSINFDQIKAEVRQQIDDDTNWCLEQDDPKPEDAMLHVYSDKEIHFEYYKEEPLGEPIVIVDAINHAIAEEMERNEKVIVFGEDVAGGKGGVFTATRGLTDRFGAHRCYNSPIAEASIIGTATGLAIQGFKPVVEIQFGDYIWPAVQEIRNQVAPLRYRSHNHFSNPMVIRVPVGGYIHGGLCHSQNIETYFAHMPGLKVVMPSNAADAKGLLKTAIRSDDPIMFLEHKSLYRQGFARMPEPGPDYLVPIGKANIVREGRDATIITYGALVQKAVTAAREWSQQGVELEVIDLRSLLPLDTDTILESVVKTGRALVFYEDYEFLGFGSEVAAIIAEKAFTALDAPVMRLAGKFAPIPFAAPMEDFVLPTDEKLKDALQKLLDF
jgi:2-oxoisovalerate dehydrogenase E1 component